MSEWLTQDEAAARLGVSRRTVERLRAEGALPYRPGRPVRISAAAIEDYLSRSEVVAAWEGDAKRLLPASFLKRALRSTGQACGKSDGLRSMQRAILAHAVIRAGRGTGP